MGECETKDYIPESKLWVVFKLVQNIAVTQHEKKVPTNRRMADGGHSSREMLDRYNTIDADDAREAMKRLRGFLVVMFCKVLPKTLPKKQKRARCYHLTL